MVERCLAGYDLPTGEREARHAQGRGSSDELRKRQAEPWCARCCSRLVQHPEREPARRHHVLVALHRDVSRVARGIPGRVARAAWPAARTSSRPSARARPISCCRATSTSFPRGRGGRLPPFSGAIEDGACLGRGAGDMKAGLAVALTIASLVRELEAPLAGRLTLAFASDEETGGTWGTQWLLDNVEAVRGDACLIGESSGTWSVGIGEKGVLWLRVRASGVSGHAAYAAGHERGRGGPRRRRGRRGAARPPREGGQGRARGRSRAQRGAAERHGDAAPAASPTGGRERGDARRAAVRST